MVKILVFIVFVFNFKSLMAADKAVPQFVFEKTHKLNGNIDVPIDYGNPEQSQKIRIAYTVFNPDSTDKPFLFFVGGGPAMSTIDRYGNLVGYNDINSYAEHFRVVMFDQRGFGGSSPLSRNPVMKAQDIVKYFFTDSHILDLAKLIERVNPKSEPFYLAGHSYGGIVISHFMQVLPDNLKPAALIFMGTLPQTRTMQDFFNARIAEQIKLNEEFFGNDLEAQRVILRAKRKINKIIREATTEHNLVHNGFDRNFIRLESSSRNYLINLAGKVLKPEVKSVEDIKRSYVIPSIDFFSPLIYALDWRFNDSVSQDSLVKNIPDELKAKIKPWMLLETRALVTKRQVASQGEDFKTFVREANRDLKDYRFPINADLMKKNISDIPTLVLLGDADVMVPYEYAREVFKDFLVDGIHHLEPIEKGGHNSMDDASVAEYAVSKLEELHQVRNSCQFLFR